MNPLARERAVMAEFRERVDSGDTSAAMRLARTLGFVALSPPFFEDDATYLDRLVRTYAPGRRRRDRVIPATVAA